MQPIDTAPKDRVIFAADRARDYSAKVMWNGHEWECVDYRGNFMGIGFYPTHWHELPIPHVTPPRENQ